MSNNKPKESNNQDHASDAAKPLNTLPKWHPYNVRADIRNKAAKKKSDSESDQKKKV